MSRLFAKIDPYGLLALLLPFSLYLLTLAPTVTFFDSGEFLTAIHSYGIAHSPGYPAFISYAKPFTYLPFGSVAFRVNVATAFAAALACLACYLLCRRLLERAVVGEESLPLLHLYTRLPALAAALAFAATPRLWLQSNHDKPYPLVTFLAAVVLLLVLRWHAEYREGTDCPGYLYAGALLTGLASAVHQTIVLMVPAYLAILLLADWRLWQRGRQLLIALGFFLLGFAIHLHEPLRAVRRPLLNWGNPSSLSQFLWNFLRQGYPVDPPKRNWSLLWDQVAAFNPVREYTWVGVALLLLGLLVAWRRSREFVVALLVAALAFLAVIVGYFNTPGELIFLTEEFFTPLYLLCAVGIGLGLGFLVRWGIARCAPMKPVAVVPLVLVITLALPTTLVALNYYENDQHRNYVAHDYATNTLRSLPERAVLFTWGDSGAFPLWYLQGVERLREDTVLLHSPHLSFAWYLDEFPQLFPPSSVLRRVNLETTPVDSLLMFTVLEQIDSRPVCIDYSTRYSVEFPNYALRSTGLLYRLVPGGRRDLPPDLAIWQRYNIRGMSGTDMPFHDLDTGKAIEIYANTLLETSQLSLRLQPKEDVSGLLRQAAAFTRAEETRGQAYQLLLRGAP